MRNVIIVAMSLFVSLALGLTGCGGGGGGAGDGGGVSYVPAKSSSFDPVTATAKTTGKISDKEVDSTPSSQQVQTHWVYKVNGGSPVTSNLNGLSIGILINSLEVSIDPNNLKKHISMSGAASGNASGQSFGGNYNVTVDDMLFINSGKTYFSNESLLMGLTLTASGESANVQLTANTKSLNPPFEWFLDRVDLDQLNLNQTFTNNSSGLADFNISMTGKSPITKSNVSVTINDTWTVMEKLASMTVQGKTYTNVIKVSRLAKSPDISGNMTSVTMNYWVAKGVGIIKGQGLYRILNVDNVVIELTDSNLTQS